MLAVRAAIMLLVRAMETGARGKIYTTHTFNSKHNFVYK